MSAPPPELARLIAAHRVVNRPDAELRDRVRAAVHRDHRRREARRWLAGGIVGAAIGLAAILVVRCAGGSWSRVQDPATGVDPHGAAYGRDGTGSRDGVAVPGVPRARDASGTGPTTLDEPKIEAPPSPAQSRTLRPPRRRLQPSVDAPAQPDDLRGAEASLEGEREVRLLRDAEVALEDDPDAALATLARHEREFPSTTMRVEREALMVLALCAAGRRIEGRGRRAGFLKAHGRSAYAARVRAACEDR